MTPNTKCPPPTIYTGSQSAKKIFNTGIRIPHVFIIQDFDLSPMEVQLAILELLTTQALSEPPRSVKTSRHGVISLPSPFLVVATSTNLCEDVAPPLLHAFMYRIPINLKGKRYYDTKIVRVPSYDLYVASLKHIYVSASLVKYINDVVSCLQAHPYVVQGPAAKSADVVVEAAKASAYLRGEKYVVPQSVMEVLLEVLAHRIVVRVPSNGGPVSTTSGDNTELLLVYSSHELELMHVLPLSRLIVAAVWASIPMIK